MDNPLLKPAFLSVSTAMAIFYIAQNNWLATLTSLVCMLSNARSTHIHLSALVDVSSSDVSFEARH